MCFEICFLFLKNEENKRNTVGCFYFKKHGEYKKDTFVREDQFLENTIMGFFRVLKNYSQQ